MDRGNAFPACPQHDALPVPWVASEHEGGAVPGGGGAARSPTPAVEIITEVALRHVNVVAVHAVADYPVMQRGNRQFRGIRCNGQQRHGSLVIGAYPPADGPLLTVWKSKK